ncbi:probable RNA-binding protein 46 [Drosophila serrata]|uniref:probable RNA-binding protein 46 n=1 Tax=Drosophila serrata TaxID=7274 RepID=UPI000A1D212E|nr:probable RNA-binding protein 46 [Drosophila serrata]
MDFESKYHKSQVNGTIYITTRQVLAKDVQESLDLGAGELFLKYIHKNISPEMIIDIASELGEIYALRYKIDFSGESRGFAYLQYIDKNIKYKALNQLSQKFINKNLDIRVFNSINARELLLERVKAFNPIQVYHEMRKLSPFIMMRVFEHRPQRFFYIFEYQNNEAAASAHRDVRNIIRMFGPQAYISWLDRCHPVSSRYGKSNCCQELDLQLQLPDPSKCNCFRFKGN